MTDYYIDDTDVSIDNRDLRTTELTYKDVPSQLFIVDTRFALQIVEDALENAMTARAYKDTGAEKHIAALYALLNHERPRNWSCRTPT